MNSSVFCKIFLVIALRLPSSLMFSEQSFRHDLRSPVARKIRSRIQCSDGGESSDLTGDRITAYDDDVLVGRTGPRDQTWVTGATGKERYQLFPLASVRSASAFV